MNDAFARIIAERRSRYTALATLPLNDPAASFLEFDRASDNLGLAGAMLFSNVNGVALADGVLAALRARLTRRTRSYTSILSIRLESRR